MTSKKVMCKICTKYEPLIFLLFNVMNPHADEASGQIDEWTNKETDEVNDACNIIYCTQ